jgi:hypothetical protein
MGIGPFIRRLTHVKGKIPQYNEVPFKLNFLGYEHL